MTALYPAGEGWRPVGEAPPFAMILVRGGGGPVRWGQFDDLGRWHGSHGRPVEFRPATGWPGRGKVAREIAAHWQRETVAEIMCLSQDRTAARMEKARAAVRRAGRTRR